MSDVGDAAQPMTLVGIWKKLSTEPCADKYPATIDFSTATYLGTRTPDQGFISWDAGIYRVEGVEDHSELVVGTATGSLVTYGLRVCGDRFEVTDADGCHLIYERVSAND